VVTREPAAVAFVPARAGSKRVRNKNVRVLGGHPLIAYTIAAARASGVFASVIVSTDSELIADIGRHYGAEAPFLRPVEYATETSPDIDWLRYTVRQLRAAGRPLQAFSILRPTSPFRKPETIRRAWRQFLSHTNIDSLRAVERCAQHPYKMWEVDGERMKPFVKDTPRDGGPAWHSRPYQALPPVYAQNASLEIAWTRVVTDQDSISGNSIAPFLTQGDEGFDINQPEDWWLAEHMLSAGTATLPEVPSSPYPVDRLPA
jgi:N-acylneuraminate cytidylyltransferase